MNVEHLKSRLTAADTAFIERTGKRPYCDANLRLYQSDEAWEADMWAYREGTRQHITGSGPTPDKAIDALMKLIAREPSEKQRAVFEFQARLGRLIDSARDADIDLKLISPLEAMARELSENILTYEAAE